MDGASTIAVKKPKDLRYRRLYFPGAELVVFDTAGKGFVHFRLSCANCLDISPPPSSSARVFVSAG